MKKRVQAILLFIIIGTVVLSTTGCSFMGGQSGGSQTTDGTQDPNATLPPQQVIDGKYVLYDAAEDFSISYHKEWKIKKNMSSDNTVNIDKSAITFTIPEGTERNENEKAKVYPTLSVFQFDIEKEEQKNFDLQTYVKEQLNYLENKVYKFTLLKEITPLTVGNKTAYTLEYIGSVLNANEVKTKQVFLTDGTSVFLLTYAANAEFYDNQNYVAIADKMIASFQCK